MARVFIVGKSFESIVDEVFTKACTRLRQPQKVAGELQVGRATVYRGVDSLGYLPSDFSRESKSSRERGGWLCNDARLAMGEGP